MTRRDVRVLIYCAGKGMLTCPTVIPWLVLAFSRGEDREEGGGGGEGIRETTPTTTFPHHSVEEL